MIYEHAGLTIQETVNGQLSLTVDGAQEPLVLTREQWAELRDFAFTSRLAAIAEALIRK